MTALQKILLVMVLLLSPLVPAQAQTAASLPPGMTQEQMDAVVSAITKSVLEKLKDDKAATARPAAATSPTADDADPVDELMRQASGLVRAIPQYGEALSRFAGLLDAGPNDSRGRGTFFLVLLGVVVAALASEALVRRAFGPMRERLATGAGPDAGMRSLAYLAGLLAIDALAVFALWVVGRGAIQLLFASGTVQDRFAFGLLAAMLLWRLYSLLFRVILRPRLPNARLCEIEDGEARHLYRSISALILLLITLRLLGLSLIAIDTPARAVEAGRLLMAPLLLAAFGAFVIGTRTAARQWLGGLGRVAPVARWIGACWMSFALVFFAALVATVLFGAVTGHHGVPGAMLLTMNLVFGLLLFETFLQAFVRRLDSQLPGFTPASTSEKLPDVAARCIRVAALIVVAVVISENWVVDVLGLVDGNAWDKITRSARRAGFTLFTAYVLWELVKFFTGAYMQKLTARALEESPGTTPGSAASRLGTLMPLVRVTLAVLIGAVAILIALSDIGVDITPLLAGLSVFGLAVSFGSQALVKDIVSGIFYLADDAFRVGETIDCGKAVGTVEGFTLRSIRLRQSSGEVHTIPFGDLGQIANHSRDWAGVNFTLRFARDVDLEKLREATNQLGTEMMDEPAFVADLLEPLKMQGIGEVADNALVVRFKFKARPGNPGRIQDEAIHRILRTFPAKGLQLA